MVSRRASSGDRPAKTSETSNDAIQKLVIILYPLLLTFVAAIIWVMLWFGLYAVN